jgi:hypothetical protein
MTIASIARIFGVHYTVVAVSPFAIAVAPAISA